jgi:hypothetical protein
VVQHSQRGSEAVETPDSACVSALHCAVSTRGYRGSYISAFAYVLAFGAVLIGREDRDGEEVDGKLFPFFLWILLLR